MDVFDFLRENAAKTLIATGFALSIVGILTLTTFFNIITLVSLPVGFTLLVFGFFAKIGLFSIEWRSINGVAAILLCVAVAFFAIAVSSIQFQEVTEIQVAPVRFDGSTNYPTGLIHEQSFILATDRPFSWLFSIAVQLGLASFLISVAAKAYSFLRSTI